jgi:flagellar secretion chaperone FliS
MNNHPVSAYQQSSARGASPVGLIVLLYDTILRDFRRALAAFESGQIEVRVFELNHAVTVIGYLQSILDSDRGGDAAKLLHHFYSMMRPMIVEVNTSPSVAGIQALIDLLTPVRQAWDQAKQLVPTSVAREASPEIRIPMVSPVGVASSVEELERENASSRWRG